LLPVVVVVAGVELGVIFAKTTAFYHHPFQSIAQSKMETRSNFRKGQVGL